MPLRQPVKRVPRLMRAMGLVTMHRRRTRRITRRHACRPVDLDRLHREFVSDAPNRVWVAGLTQHRTEVPVPRRGELGHGRPVRAELVVDAVIMVVRRRRPRPGRIHHCDHGAEDNLLAFTRRLEALVT